MDGWWDEWMVRWMEGRKGERQIDQIFIQAKKKKKNTDKMMSSH